MRFTNLQNSHLIGRCWWRNANFCLHDELFLDFLAAICRGKRVDLNSHWLSSFCKKRTDKPSVLITLVHGDRWHENLWHENLSLFVSMLHVLMANCTWICDNYRFLVTLQMLNIYHCKWFWNIAHEDDFIIAFFVVSLAMLIFMTVITKLILVS